VLYHRSRKLWAILISAVIVTVVGGGITAVLKMNSDNAYHLEFTEISKSKIESLDLTNITVIEEKIVDNGLSAFIYKDNDGYKGAINKDGQTFGIGRVSMENTSQGMMGIDEIQVFGKRAVKLYGILGANYAQAFYWLIDEKTEDSVIQIDGNTNEADLDNDDSNEIIATIGTIPETRIYMLKEGAISVCDINKSIGARSVYLKNEGSKLFEVYFKANKPEQFVYENDCFVRKQKQPFIDLQN
jgi:uncharacterized protein YhbP (UPF0306 family)